MNLWAFEDTHRTPLLRGRRRWQTIRMYERRWSLSPGPLPASKSNGSWTPAASRRHDKLEACFRAELLWRGYPTPEKVPVTGGVPLPDLVFVDRELFVDLKNGGPNITISERAWQSYTNICNAGLDVLIVHAPEFAVATWTVAFVDELWERRIGGLNPPRPGHKNSWYCFRPDSVTFDDAFPYVSDRHVTQRIAAHERAIIEAIP